ncbi:MAG TPA: enoyl-CoA hydratase-related protein [Nitrososphaeraceae archaeon]|jgi:3-hydroxypropionyl-coenzyme A dehydratase|nr:enoyl-CoA hydratase-related protein [Nitrososphaeraceae archaeon]
MKYIQLEPREEIAIIRINRQEALNAMNIDVITELSKTIDIVGVDDGIRAIILTGAGERSFCAGADIAYMANIDPVQAEKYASSAQAVLNKIENLQKPVIAAVNGFALGGGCELAMVCDIRIASSNAKLGQPEVTIGIPPGWGGTQRLLRIVGPAKAKELVFTGKMITAEEAERIGLVNRIVGLTPEEENTTTKTTTKTTTVNPSDSSSKEQLNNEEIQKREKQRDSELAKVLNKKLMNECLSFAKEITKNSFTAVKTSKMLINKGMDADIDTGLRLEIYGWALCFAHEDRQKMMSSFLNKGKK